MARKADGARTTMKLTQVTHNDLDGYGASTVVGNLVSVARVEHVVRYADVVPVLEAEFRRLIEARDPEALLVTDIAVEPGFAGLAALFADANAGRTQPHRLLVIDHHASSVPSLEAVGFARDATSAFPRWAPAGGTGHVEAFVDVSRSATRLCADLAPLIAGVGHRRAPFIEPSACEALADAIDAVDLWKRDRAAFDPGEAINELFWEVVLTYVPPGHEMHDAFIGRILAGAAGLLGSGATADEIEAAGPALRKQAVHWLLAQDGIDETERQRAMTSRMRVSRLLARSENLFVTPFDGLRIKVSHGLDPGIMQRTSDAILDADGADVVVNVMRGGAMSFRSIDGQALGLAERFGGGGHPTSAGARLPSTSVFSLPEAVRLMREVIEPPPQDL
jgi:oligoribonuclease NrnB/cAMP/cGMP phosphodiesterase (DHH superfamily)